jgi:hypothetical protein
VVYLTRTLRIKVFGDYLGLSLGEKSILLSAFIVVLDSTITFNSLCISRSQRLLGLSSNDGFFIGIVIEVCGWVGGIVQFHDRVRSTALVRLNSLLK